MALSLPGERSVAAGSHVNPIRALFAWFTRAKTNRARRAAMQNLLQLDQARLRDLGITPEDVLDAMAARDGRTPGMVLHAARARNARG
ncbi:protein of unknown function [Devosia lucknowensis]|uniref:DUF1127 domain-containing protein n=1 Tax=Devosia lucknowensis TaxID=1096929 RepID=A0A1Y6EAQ1_9HYPH|nr:DUF1127 domain-containing protein [Devosia lucknowensis]SMQ59606.1 protein of unknown function [Devosia lucknowensis]